MFNYSKCSLIGTLYQDHFFSKNIIKQLLRLKCQKYSDQSFNGLPYIPCIRVQSFNNMNSNKIQLSKIYKISSSYINKASKDIKYAGLHTQRASCVASISSPQTSTSDDETTSNSVPCSQLIMEEYGEPHKVVKMSSCILPPLKPGQALVKLLAAPIHPSDINTIQGTYAIKPALPCVLGNEGVAEVLEVLDTPGEPVGLVPGDWVVPRPNAWGTWRTHAVDDQQHFIKLPAGLDVVAAATLTVNPCTAYRLLRDFVPLQPGDTIIQNAANSAVGRALIQLCRHYGYRSINVVRDRPDIAALKQELLDQGATVVVTEAELRSDAGVKSAGSPKLALNCVSGKSGAEILRQLQLGGTMVTYGGMARQPVTVPVSSLIFNDVRLAGFWQTRWSQAPENREERQRMLDDLCDLMKQGKLRPPPHKLVPFNNFTAAIEDAMPSQGKVGAKQILVFD